MKLNPILLAIALVFTVTQVGVAQLPQYFSTILGQRKSIFRFYQDYFSTNPWAILPPFQNSDKISSCHLYALRIKDVTEGQRDAIIDKISKAGVAVNVHFQPLPLLSLFKSYGYKIEDYPNAYNNYKAEISLPIYPQLTQEELDYIVSTISNAVESTL